MRKPVGEDKAAKQDTKIEETVALLKILEIGERQVEQGQTDAAEDVIMRLRGKRKK